MGAPGPAQSQGCRRERPRSSDRVRRARHEAGRDRAGPAPGRPAEELRHRPIDRVLDERGAHHVVDRSVEVESRMKESIEAASARPSDAASMTPTDPTPRSPRRALQSTSVPTRQHHRPAKAAEAAGSLAGERCWRHRPEQVDDVMKRLVQALLVDASPLPPGVHRSCLRGLFEARKPRRRPALTAGGPWTPGCRAGRSGPARRGPRRHRARRVRPPARRPGRRPRPPGNLHAPAAERPFASLDRHSV